MTKTINDVYMELFKRLKEADDPQPSLSAREITAYACKADKNKTADWGHVYLDDATVDYAHLLCDRCLDGEPLAYILGEWDFYGLTFQIDRSVLIPRSDTERLCELVIGQARQRVSPRILDLCCGSGCIGIAAAHEVEDARRGRGYFRGRAARYAGKCPSAGGAEPVCRAQGGRALPPAE